MATDPNVLARGGPPRPKTRRVYKAVSIDQKDGRFRVLLDGKPVMSPMRGALATEKRALAEALAAEWDAQNPFIEPEAMPLTRLASTAMDRVAPQREAMVDELMKYIDGDLLCYRANYPPELKARQTAVWQPVLDWLSGALGVTMTAVEGLMPHRQTAKTADDVRRVISALDHDHLTALQASAAITTSLALSLALTHGRITGAEAFAAASLDESYQMEKWGEDELALGRSRHIEADLLAIGEYLRLLKLP
jgi:chaperone required for assembly of F1-ATPase